MKRSFLTKHTVKKGFRSNSLTSPPKFDKIENMKNSLSLILALSILFFSLNTTIVSNSITYTYNETINNATYPSTWKIIPLSPNQKQIISDSTYDTSTFNINGIYTQKYEVSRKEESLSFIAEKKDKQIHISGTKNGKPITKIMDLKNQNWVQTPGLVLHPFIKSNDSKIVFSLLSIASQSLIEMTLRKQELITKKINNKSQKTLKTSVSPTGILGWFWSADLYFDPTTGDLLEYIGPLGGWGSPILKLTLSKKTPQ